MRLLKPALCIAIASAAFCASLCAAAPPLTEIDLALINRVTWGLTDHDARQAQALGIEPWLQAQLHPARGDHLAPAVAAQIAAMPALQKTTSVLARELYDQVQAEKVAQAQIKTAATQQIMLTPATQTPTPAANPVMIRPQAIRGAYLRDVQRQTQARHVLRDLYSADQLREQMTWFWFNHFNVYTNKATVRIFLADYEDHALRPNALGTFRTMLEATLRNPAMLEYLDNAQNAAGKINENYAREIMELHTLGLGAGGAGNGYTQKDVQELARILTGVSIVRPQDEGKFTGRLPAQAIRDGMFAFYPMRHDFGDKLFLGHVIKGSGYHEVEQALDLLATHPATARHIATKLAQYFVSDQPPASLINTMAARFMSSNGDIAAVLDTMFHSPEFRASLSTPLLKDPQHYVLSAVRMAYDDRPIVNAGPIIGWLDRLAQPLYGHLTPDGYALDRSAWNGPGQIEQRFEIAQQLGNGAAGLFKADEPSASAQPAFPTLKGALYYNGLSETLAPATRTALAQAGSPQEWNMLFLASPDFMRR